MLTRQDGTILFEGRDGLLYEAEFGSLRFGGWEVREVFRVETGCLAYPPECLACGFNEPVCPDGYCRSCHTDQQAGCLRGVGL